MNAPVQQEDKIFLDCDLAESQPLVVAGGTAVVYTARCPGKTTANEDAAAVLPCGTGAAVLAVADGMGGASQGEVASRRAIESLQAEVHAARGSGDLLRSAIISGIEKANQAVQQLGVGAGTTLAVVEIAEGTIRPYHVGDSMILVVGGRGKIKLQTVPHSPVGYGVEAGLLDRSEAMNHEDRHVVSNFVGTPAMRIDVGSSLKLARRDTLLLASDGLFDNLHDDEIAGRIRKGKLPRAAAQLAGDCAARMSATDAGPSKPDDMTFVAFRPGGNR